MNNVDIVEFAERFYDAKIPEWQKDYLRRLSELPKDTKIYVRVLKDQGKHQFYIYMKELIQNGPTYDNKQ